MNSAETDIMGMLHTQGFLARSKEMFLDKLQIQGPSIDIIEAIRYSLPNMQPPPAAGNAFKNGMESKRAGR
jgi:hypothetical protein